METLCNYLESRMDEDVDKTSVLLGENGDIGVIAFINKIGNLYLKFIAL